MFSQTQGFKIRSQGRGRGLAVGSGKGPLGVPILSKKENQLGQWDLIIPALTSVVQVGGTVASSLITSGSAKDIAKIQASTAASTAAVQERIAQLQLAALQQPAAVAAQPATQTITAGLGIPSQILGIPILYLVAGGGALLFFLLRRKGEN